MDTFGQVQGGSIMLSSLVPLDKIMPAPVINEENKSHNGVGITLCGTPRHLVGPIARSTNRVPMCSDGSCFLHIRTHYTATRGKKNIVS